MKTFIRLFSFALVALAMTACGSNNNQIVGYNADGTPIYGNGTQTGYYNGAQGGCVPLQSALSFTIQGPRISATDILGGTFPQLSRAPGQQLGQVIMGGSVGVTQQYGYAGSMMLTKQSSNGTLQLQVSQNQITGSLQLNQYIAQMLMMGTQQVYGNNGYYNMQYPSQGYNTGACVSSVAIDAVYQQGYTGQGYILQALVYLYMSNSQTPIGPIPLY